MPRSTVHRPWTRDTRTAFLLALRLTGQVRLAAAEIGRVHGVCYQVRRRDPAFAAAWDAILAEHAAQRRVAQTQAKAAVNARRRAARAASREGVAPDPERDASGNRARRDGLNRVKRRAFLRGLSETGSVAEAALAAGVSDTAAYNLRARDGDFAAAWDRALRVSAPVLEQIAFERAVHGWEEPVFAGGRQVGMRRRFSEPLLRHFLLRQDKAKALANDPAALEARAEEAAKAAGGHFMIWPSEEETNAKILAALDRMAQRTRRAAAVEAERLLALGLVP